MVTHLKSEYRLTCEKTEDSKGVGRRKGSGGRVVSAESIVDRRPKERNRSARRSKKEWFSPGI